MYQTRHLTQLLGHRQSDNLVIAHNQMCNAAVLGIGTARADVPSSAFAGSLPAAYTHLCSWVYIHIWKSCVTRHTVSDGYSNKVQQETVTLRSCPSTRLLEGSMPPDGNSGTAVFYLPGPSQKTVCTELVKLAARHEGLTVHLERLIYAQNPFCCHLLRETS